MNIIVKRLLLVVGLLLYIFDFASDIYVAVQYWKNNEVWWFSLTIIFIVVPSIMVNVTGIFQLPNIWTYLASILQLSILVRYIETFISPETRELFLARLCYLETITESAPQWCLQVYIMLRQWYFPSYTVFSSVLSFLALAWSITTLENARMSSKHRDFKPSARISFLIWQSSTLVSRLPGIVIIAYVFRYYAIIFLVVHSLLVTGCMFLVSREYDHIGKDLLIACVTAYPSLFHSSKIDSESSHGKMNMRYILLLVENAVLVTMSLTIKIPNVPHIDVLKDITNSCLLGGSVVSIISFTFYYCCADRDIV